MLPACRQAPHAPQRPRTTRLRLRVRRVPRWRRHHQRRPRGPRLREFRLRESRVFGEDCIARPVHVHMNLAPFEWQGTCTERTLKHFGVEPLQQSDVAALLGRGENDDAAALLWRKLAVVKIIAVEANQGAPQLSGEPVVLAVARASKVWMLDDEQ